MSKEITVTVPVVILLYDRTFITGSFREAWRQHWRYYLGLAGTWLLLAHLMTGLNQRAAVGFDEGVTWWSYALTSCQSVVRYLELALWPHPLILDYGFDLAHDAMTVLPFMLVLVVLAAGVVISLWRWPMVGFAGAWFFLILAPTTSIVPVTGQPMAEHRMYLPLAGVVVLIVLGLHRLLGRQSFPVLLVLAAVFGWLTSQRNETYRTEERIWRDTVAKCPDNERAHYGLGIALARAGRITAAVTEYEEALRLRPDYPEAHSSFGSALKAEGRMAEAIAQCEEALRLKPDFAEAHNTLGGVLFAEGRTAGAIAECEEALRLKPDYAEAHNNLGIVLNAEGRTAEAIAQCEEALRLNPDFAEAHNSLGNALGTEGRTAEAIAQYEEAVRLQPDMASIHFNLALALLKVPGQANEAATHLEAVLRLQPDNDRARKILANIAASGP
jgi:tetratricopeptide (TPR) repeat protein